MRKIRWGRLVRRSLAVCLTAVALWLLPAGSAGVSLAENGDFVTAALRTELGDRGQGGPGFWQRLALGQSLLLERNLTEPEEGGSPAETPEPLPNAQPAPDHDDVQDQPQVTAAPEDIVERTLTPTGSGGYVTGAGLYLYNRTDLTEDLAAEQKARVTYDNILRLSDDPDVNDVIRFLRAREIVHFQRFGEGLRLAKDKMNEKNVYYMNPAFDK